MQILLIAATRLEIEPAIHFIENKNGRPGNPGINFLITGAGMLSTAYSLMRRIRDQRPGCIIQAGIGGSFADAGPGKLLAVKEDTPADLGVVENNHFRSLFDLQLADPDEFPFSKGFLTNPFGQLLFLSGLERVRAITVNEITTDKSRLGEYAQTIKPAVESMEGAAFHYVCLSEKIPFLQIRAISNPGGERD
jgi:futalosine hydrolase